MKLVATAVLVLFLAPFGAASAARNVGTQSLLGSAPLALRTPAQLQGSHSSHGVPPELSSVFLGKAGDGSNNVDPPSEGMAGGGDTFASATVIPALPYTDGGSTVGFNNDYTAPCAQAGPPDVVYSFTPATNTCVTISLCGSGFDTALHLYRDSAAGFVACNDDFCGGSPQQSKLRSVALEAGHVYYIVVDGFGCDFFGCSQGSYTLSVTTDCPAPCVVDCPPGAIEEGEAAICNITGTNDGCNLAVPAFTDIACSAAGVTVCGTYGSLPDASVRDTDWYRLVVTERSRITFCGTGEATTNMIIADISGGCGGIVTLASGAAEPCQEQCLQATVNPGTYILFVASIFATDIPCGKKYKFTATCEPIPPCVVDCPPGAIEEGETTICDVNGTNDGCNMAVPVYTDIACSSTGVTVCGTYGSLPDASARDTDWYRLVATEPSRITLCGVGEAITNMFILDLNAGCGGFTILASGASQECQEQCLQVSVNPGTYVLVIASNFAANIPCGKKYRFTATCEPVTLADLHCNDANGVSVNLGQTVTATGIVTSNFPTAANSRFTIQDASGGMTVFGSAPFCGVLGDKVQVTGNMLQFSGLTELGNPLSIVTLSNGNPQPAALVLTPAQVNASFHADFCEPNESRLVRVVKVTIVSSGGTPLPPGSTFGGNTTYGLLAEDASLTSLRIVQATPNICTSLNPLVGMLIPGGPVNVTGVLSQFDSTLPLTSGYQVQPRQPGDIVMWDPLAVVPGQPIALAIAPPYPNPARGTVAFGLDLPSAGWADAAVFDLTGRKVAGIASGSFGPGRHVLKWDGLTSSRVPASSGIYFIRVTAAGHKLSRRFVVAH